MGFPHVRQTITSNVEPGTERDGELIASQLEHVLDGVADGVVLTSRGRSTLNQAARRILGLAEGASFHTSMLKPRALDGTPFDVPADRLPA